MYFDGVANSSGLFPRSVSLCGVNRRLLTILSVLDPPTPEGISVATPPRGEIVVPSPTTSLQFPSRCSDNECSTLREQYVLSYEFEPVPGDIVKQQVVYRQVPTHNLPYFCYVNLMSSIGS